MDELARYNQQRWQELVEAGVQYSRPWLDLTADSARQHVDPEGMVGDFRGLRVLCLAGGGGQQSAAFGLLGADVTVLDFCEGQLQRDREAAEHYGIEVATAQGDMRDLSRFEPVSFDLLWQAHSLNFVPDARVVFGEVARVLKPGGLYRLHCTNPFIHGLWNVEWNGQGYPLSDRYADAEILLADPRWDVHDADGNLRKVQGPREFRHKLSTLINGLIASGFALEGTWEDDGGDIAAESGSWSHFCAIAPPWLTFWSRRLGSATA